MRDGIGGKSCGCRQALLKDARVDIGRQQNRGRKRKVEMRQEGDWERQNRQKKGKDKL